MIRSVNDGNSPPRKKPRTETCPTCKLLIRQKKICWKNLPFFKFN